MTIIIKVKKDQKQQLDHLKWEMDKAENIKKEMKATFLVSASLLKLRGGGTTICKKKHHIILLYSLLCLYGLVSVSENMHIRYTCE